MEKKKNPLLIKIGTGIIQGLPLLRTIKERFKPSVITTMVEVAGNPAPVEAKVQLPRPEWKVIITEAIIVGLILAFVFDRITIADLQVLVGLLK